MDLTEQNLKDIAAAVANVGVRAGNEIVPLGLATGRSFATVRRLELALTGTNAALDALATSKGADPAVIRKAVDDALSSYTLKLEKDSGA